MKPIQSLLIIFLFACTGIQGQKHYSIHQEHSKYYKSFQYQTETEWDKFHGIKPVDKPISKYKNACNTERIVFGWHPYWVGSAYNNYDWNLMTDFSFFSYEVNAATGQANSTHGWTTSPAVDLALANGVRVNLCVTLFSDHTTFFASASAKQTLITNLINMVQSRGAHGVNIDFEGVPIAEKQNYTDWLIDLSNQMKAVDPNYQISIATYAVDWSELFDVVALKDYIDLFCIMGYGYYWGGSTYAGPTDPLYTFMTSYNYSLSRTLTYYLDKGVPKDQLVLGLPYYGREWPTASSVVPSTTTANGSAKFFNTVMNNTNGYYNTRLWDENSFTPYYTFESGGTWRQCFVMDGPSLENRLDLINRRDIAGMAIWALGYDEGYTDLWDAIRNKLTDCEVVECTGTIYDMGGPNRNYYNDEDYTYTISPDNAVSVTLDFTSFDVEANYDYLYLYDGPTTSDPLIGTYTGTNSPGIVTSTGGDITVRFTSDGATVNPGWVANWTCDDTYIPPAPTTEIVTSYIPVPVVHDTPIHFVDLYDTDIIEEQRLFVQTCENDGTEWRSNPNNGCYNDDFDNGLHGDWVNHAGIWSVQGGTLYQSDESVGNTILSAAMDQSGEDEYMYHWESSIGGSGTNRRAGLHFLCDDPQLSNRGNSYFVYYRIDSDKLQLYEVNGNTYTLVSNTDYVFNLNQTYDFKVTFNTVTGRMDVYIDDIFAISWTDPTPLSSGSYVSFRSGNCTYTVDNFRVYKSRENSVYDLSVGLHPSNDIRHEGPAAGMLRSIIIDNNNQLSLIDEATLNIDYKDNIDIQNLSREQAISDARFKVFPNPTKDELNVGFQNKHEYTNEIRIRISDGNGRIISEQTYSTDPGTNIFNIEEFARLSKGIYWLQLTTDEQREVKKIVKL